jgi:hypothetical protein
MAAHAAVETRTLTAHLHYCPPFQPWGLLHGVAVTVSGVLFWVGVWDILDYAVLPRGWQWRVRAEPRPPAPPASWACVDSLGRQRGSLPAVGFRLGL